MTAMIAAGDLNWTALTELAAASRAAPLLYDALCEQKDAPPKILDALRAAHDSTLRYNMYLFVELRRALRRLQEQGVPVIVLKGAALAQVVYGNPALRPMRDLDLLVPQESFVRVKDTLLALGYTLPRVETQSGAALAFESEMMFSKATPLLCQVEVHWNLIDSPFYQKNLTTDWFWETSLPFAIDNVSAQMLGPEAQILHLCAHLLLHHGGSDLLWHNDVVQVIRFYDSRIGWDELLTRGEALGLGLALRTILRAVVDEWGAPIPIHIVGKLSELSVSPTEARLVRALTTPGRSPAKRLWSDLMSLPGWQQRLSFALINLFPSPEYMRQRYGIENPVLVALSYPYRWWLGTRNALKRR